MINNLMKRVKKNKDGRLYVWLTDDELDAYKSIAKEISRRYRRMNCPRYSSEAGFIGEMVFRDMCYDIISDSTKEFNVNGLDNGYDVIIKDTGEKFDIKSTKKWDGLQYHKAHRPKDNLDGFIFMVYSADLHYWECSGYVLCEYLEFLGKRYEAHEYVPELRITTDTDLVLFEDEDLSTSIHHYQAITSMHRNDEA